MYIGEFMYAFYGSFRLFWGRKKAYSGFHCHKKSEEREGGFFWLCQLHPYFLSIITVTLSVLHCHKVCKFFLFYNLTWTFLGKKSQLHSSTKGMELMKLISHACLLMWAVEFHLDFWILILCLIILKFSVL